jgi:prepilin-type N-terminal cleavage/methylation domain-containing protein
MKRRQNKTGYHVGYPTAAGVTLVEIIVVVAIVAILTALVISIASRTDTQGKEKLTENTIALLTAALGEFRDYGYTYSGSYAGLKFPLDCNNFNTSDFLTKLTWTIGGPGVHMNEYSGCEAMYFFLSRVPESRQTLTKIDKSLVTARDEKKQDMTVTVGSQVYPLFRVIDPWGKTLRYSYYNNNNEGTTGEPPSTSPLTFPLITSAGPDTIFGTDDDITGK